MYPAATQKVWLIYVYINELQCMCKSMCIPVLRFSCYVDIDNKAMRECTKYDDKINTLAFVNFLLIKIFQTLIYQNFPLPKFCDVLTRPYQHLTIKVLIKPHHIMCVSLDISALIMRFEDLAHACTVDTPGL